MNLIGFTMNPKGYGNKDETSLICTMYVLGKACQGALIRTLLPPHQSRYKSIQLR
jgi:hypothetical protein